MAVREIEGFGGLLSLESWVINYQYTNKVNPNNIDDKINL